MMGVGKPSVVKDGVEGPQFNAKWRPDTLMQRKAPAGTTRQDMTRHDTTRHDR
jgi:hypothetical protein